MPIRVSRDAKTGRPRYLATAGYFPFSDFAGLFDPNEQLVSKVLGEGIERVSPGIMLPFELAMNRSYFFDSDIKKYPGHTQDFLFWQVPAKARHALRAVRALNELDKLNPGGVFGEERVGRPTQATEMDRWVSYFTGLKTYPLDEFTAARHKEYREKRAISKLKAQLKWAKREYAKIKDPTSKRKSIIKIRRIEEELKKARQARYE